LGFLSIILTLGFIACTGNGNSGSDSKLELRNAMQLKLDSAWSQLNDIRGQFHFEIDEFEERKTEMAAQRIRANFIPGDALTDDDKLQFNIYNETFRVYKTAANQYKNAVLMAENAFYNLKGLETRVKKGDFDQDLEGFKEEMMGLQKDLDECELKTIDITDRLDTVEPSYQRVNEHVNQLLDRLVPEKQ
jgi:hypothetical protein